VDFARYGSLNSKREFYGTKNLTASSKLQKEQGLAHLETLGRPAEDNDVYDESDEDVEQEVVSKPARNLFDLVC
jgi:hypothetical protein